jgi:dTDP-4-amino-4,6-dideoxygalactose transaminase
MLDIEARVGLVQLRKYPEVVSHRESVVRYYAERLQGIHNLALPPLVEGATYSHYCVLAQNRQPWITAMCKAGVQLGQLIEYSIPQMPAYHKYRDRDFPNACRATNAMLNLPVHLGVGEAERHRVVENMFTVAHGL